MSSLYSRTLPEVFPWMMPRVKAKQAAKIARFLCKPGTTETGPGQVLVVHSGSSFAVVAGIHYTERGLVDIYLSSVSLQRIHGNPELMPAPLFIDTRTGE